LERGNSCLALRRRRLVNTFNEKNSFSSKNLNSKLLNKKTQRQYFSWNFVIPSIVFHFGSVYHLLCWKNSPNYVDD
jgi:hypothetical protein